MPERLVALVQGLVDAAPLNPPTDLMAMRQGMTQLADMGALGIPYVGNSLHVRESLIKDNPQVVQNMVKALTEAIYVFQTNKDVAIKALKTNMKVDDQEVLDYTWNSVKDKLEKVPLPTAEGVQALIKLSALEDPTLADLPAESVVDPSFVNKLQTSGFIDNLYKDTSNSGTQQ
jgi:ABC-type nitrate/sulfonate/bicarbonate transport system substrate-binding protein